jgi:hypothetical protein
LPDGYAEVKIEAVTPGAELGGVIYDQWVTVSRAGVRLELFDQDCICPESLAGTTQRVGIGLMATRIAPSQSEATSVKGNTFVVRVMPRARAASKFDADAVVYSLVDMEEAVYGDEVEWIFEGPGGIVNEASVALEYQGEVYAYAFVDLSDWGTEDVKGDWRVTVYLNGVEASTESFSVEGGGGFSIPMPLWMPLVGIAAFVLFSQLFRKQ